MSNSAVWARILLRYGSGFLVGWGVLTDDEASELLLDPDVVLVVGGFIAFMTESLYAMAKSRGWNT